MFDKTTTVFFRNFNWHRRGMWGIVLDNLKSLWRWPVGPWDIRRNFYWQNIQKKFLAETVQCCLFALKRTLPVWFWSNLYLPQSFNFSCFFTGYIIKNTFILIVAKKYDLKIFMRRTNYFCPKIFNAMLSLQVVQTAFGICEKKSNNCKVPHQCYKGQLISECPFDAWKFSKIPPKNLIDFCPGRFYTLGTCDLFWLFWRWLYSGECQHT